MEVMHNRGLTHESVVNPLVINCGRFEPSIGAVVIENELPTNGRDVSGVPDNICSDTLKFSISASRASSDGFCSDPFRKMRIEETRFTEHNTAQSVARYG